MYKNVYLQAANEELLAIGIKVGYCSIYTLMTVLLEYIANYIFCYSLQLTSIPLLLTITRNSTITVLPIIFS